MGAVYHHKPLTNPSTLSPRVGYHHALTSTLLWLFIAMSHSACCVTFYTSLEITLISGKTVTSLWFVLLNSSSFLNSGVTCPIFHEAGYLHWFYKVVFLYKLFAWLSHKRKEIVKLFRCHQKRLSFTREWYSLFRKRLWKMTLTQYLLRYFRLLFRLCCGWKRRRKHLSTASVITLNNFPPNWYLRMSWCTFNARKK